MSGVLNFFIRAAAGQFQLGSPEQLLKLLRTMARNKVTNEAKKHQAERRDYRRVEKGTPEEREIVDPGASPSQIALNKDLLEEFRRRLDPQERWLADQRAQGRSWSELAAEVGEKPAALRMRLNRAVDRVARELHLEE